MTLRCYARQIGGRWHALCGDLDIAADGASLEEARASLAACIEMYLDGIDTLPAEERRQRLTRKAPLHVRANMALLSFLQRLRGTEASCFSFVLEAEQLTPAHV